MTADQPALDPWQTTPDEPDNVHEHSGYGRPATRPPRPADRWRLLYRLTELPAIDHYTPTEGDRP